MTPLTADKKALDMPGYLEDMNIRITYWCRIDARVTMLLKKEEQLGRIAMTITGIGEAPRVPAA